MNDVLDKIDQLSAKIEPYKGVARQGIEDLQNFARDLREGLSIVQKEDRLFCVAVLGQVKAGKSSFLNALLFDGTGVLPAAAEPMTAALTVIRYAEKCRAEVEFFSQNEWDNLKKCADEYERIYEEEERKIIDFQSRQLGNRAPVAKKPPKSMVEQKMPDGTKSAYRLMCAIDQKGLNVSEYIGLNKVLPEVQEPQALIAELQDYIGAEGKYTLLVSSVVLYYNDERIKGIEIVDTPGLNDPVIERTRRTKALLKKCDAAFFLSRTSSFLDTNDLELLSQNLPAEGVNEIILVASRFDNEFIGEKDRYSSFDALFNANHESMRNRVKTTFGQFDKADLPAGKRKIIDKMKATDPIPVSSMAYMIAAHWDNLSSQEEDALAGFRELYPEDPTPFATAEKLLNISSIPKAKNLLRELQDCKVEVRKEKQIDYLKNKAPALTDLIKEISETVRKQATELDSCTIEELERQEKDISGKLLSGNSGCNEVFETAIVKMMSNLELLSTELKELALQFQKIDVRSETSTHSYQEQVSRSGFWGGIADFIWPKYETRTSTTTTHYANTHDAIDQVEAFAVAVEKELKRAIMGIVDLSALKNGLLDKTASLFDLSSENFDTDFLLTPLRRSVQSISIPKLEFGTVDYSLPISKKFSGTVSGSTVDELKKAQKSAIKEIISDFCREIANKEEAISKSLGLAQQEFISTVTKNISENLDQIRKNLLNIKESKKTMQELIKILESFSLN